MSVPTDQPGRLKELVDVDAVAALLVGRSPRVVTDPARRPVVNSIIAGRAAEVAQVIGDPPPATVCDLAVWAVTLATAASIELSLFPEGQLGDGGRGQDLQVQYLSVLAQLRASTAGRSGAQPGGFYPEAQPWPEPALSTQDPWRSSRTGGYR